jgi:ribosomal protein S18 acetylase RimI-like enzyme
LKHFTDGLNLLGKVAFDILLFLVNNPEYKTASDIVEYRGIKANLISVNVDKLVRDRYLKKKNVKSDRRKTMLICTDKAQECYSIKRKEAYHICININGRAIKMSKENTDKKMFERYEFRNIHMEEISQAAEIEKICFPPNEACTYKHMEERIKKAKELFLVAVDRDTGKIVGFLNGLATNREHLTDDFFEDADVHEAEGRNIMLLGLDVLPEYRCQGLARELMRQYLEREKQKGRKRVVLTCLPDKVRMYEKFGFEDHGIGESVWGGEAWYEMSIILNE